MTEPRTPTTIDRIAEDWVTTVTDLDPTIATYIGLPGRLGDYGDYSPAGAEAMVSAAKRTLRALDSATPVDEVDRVTLADLRSTLELDIDAHDAKLHLRDLNVLASPATEIRDIFDLMPTETESDWRDIASRMKHLPAAVDGYIETLRTGIAEGVTPARRQVLAVAELTARVGDPAGFFSSFAGEAGDIPDSLRSELTAVAATAADAYAGLTTFLRSELAPEATEVDAVGREAYALHSRRFLGSTIDLDETYEWGIDELARMTAEQESVAKPTDQPRRLGRAGDRRPRRRPCSHPPRHRSAPASGCSS
jgi:uncharacterized protein (DUF885 family)